MCLRSAEIAVESSRPPRVIPIHRITTISRLSVSLSSVSKKFVCQQRRARVSYFSLLVFIIIEPIFEHLKSELGNLHNLAKRETFCLLNIVDLIIVFLEIGISEYLSRAFDVVTDISSQTLLRLKQSKNQAGPICSKVTHPLTSN